MSDSEERRKALASSNAFLAGERINGVKFRHNSQVRILSASGASVEGWVVAVSHFEPEPIYTIERSDGNGDEEVRERELELIFD
ncbi:hypothetical protein KC726_06260, partial [Candidatus Woesebacteria bacterium]|nr:hypothetical protein [Candidatus Woesebacteria bacterium]